MLSNRWHKDDVRTAKNCQILYPKFHFLFKNIQRKIVRKFLSTVALSLPLENFICATPIWNLFCRLFSSQSWYKRSHCYASTLNSKESSIRLLTVSDKRNIKSVFKYSLVQEKERCNNAQQSFASALRYWVWVCRNIITYT